MKLLKKIFIISFLLILLVYVSSITSIPSKVTLFEGEKINLKTVFGLNIEEIEKEPTILTSTNIANNINSIRQVNYKVNLFGRIPLKEIDVSVIPKAYVVPLGNIVGLKLYTNGVLVVGMSEIDGQDNKKYKPYENTGIEQGDMLIKLNNESISCTAELLEKVYNSKGQEMQVEYVRDGEVLTTSIIPIMAEDNKYKLGLWVRDAAAGVGTASFYDVTTKTFAALGHGILDVDTEELLNIAEGEFITSKIASIKKGTKGNPGKIQGTIDNGITIGKVYKNTEFGVFGKVTNESSLDIDLSKAVEVATRDQIKLGKAQIMCTLENNETKKYDIEITKIYTNNNENNKSMLVKITDKELIEKTGGIIQGMSGSPIIQNGKVIGALTHVLVNDPQTGYGVFADLMLKKAREIN